MAINESDLNKRSEGGAPVDQAASRQHLSRVGNEGTRLALGRWGVGRRRNHLGGGHSRCKGPEVDMCLGHQTKADGCTGRQEASVRESSGKHRDPPYTHETSLPGRWAPGKSQAGSKNADF